MENEKDIEDMANQLIDESEDESNKQMGIGDLFGNLPFGKMTKDMDNAKEILVQYLIFDMQFKLDIYRKMNIKISERQIQRKNELQNKLKEFR